MDLRPAIERFRQFTATEGGTLGRLLGSAERAIARETLGRLLAAGYRNITFAQLQLVQAMCLGAVRVTELAERMQMSKQAVGQLIDALEKQGLVERAPDPGDRRAKIITYTDVGERLLADAIDITLSVERDTAQRVGRGYLGILKTALARMADERQL